MRAARRAQAVESKRARDRLGPCARLNGIACKTAMFRLRSVDAVPSDMQRPPTQHIVARGAAEHAVDEHEILDMPWDRIDRRGREPSVGIAQHGDVSDERRLALTRRKAMCDGPCERDKITRRLATTEPPRNAAVREAAGSVQHKIERRGANAIPDRQRGLDERFGQYRMLAEKTQRHVITVRLDPAALR